jgi:hypothetical protein
MQIKVQCQAFLRGFQDVIRVDWIRFFNPIELQLLISGERKGDFDVADLRYATYANVCRRMPADLTYATYADVC